MIGWGLKSMQQHRHWRAQIPGVLSLLIAIALLLFLCILVGQTWRDLQDKQQQQMYAATEGVEQLQQHVRLLGASLPQIIEQTAATAGFFNAKSAAELGQLLAQHLQPYLSNHAGILLLQDGEVVWSHHTESTSLSPNPYQSNVFFMRMSLVQSEAGVSEFVVFEPLLPLLDALQSEINAETWWEWRDAGGRWHTYIPRDDRDKAQVVLATGALQSYDGHQLRLVSHDIGWLDAVLAARRFIPMLVVGAIILIAFWWRQRWVVKQYQDLASARKQLQKYAGVTLQTMQEGVVVTDMQAKVVYLNPAAESMLGLSFAETNEKSLSQLIKIERSVLESHYARSVPYYPSTRSIDPIELGLEANASPIVEQDETIGVVWLLHDVSESRAALNALANSELRYRNTLKNSLVGVFVIQQQHFTYVNDRFCEIVGYERETLLSAFDPVSLAVKEQQPQLRQNIQRRLEGERGEPYELRVHRQNGQQLDILVWGNPGLYDNSLAIYGSIMDISARKQAESLLRKSAQRFRSTFERVGVGLVVADMRPVARQLRALPYKGALLANHLRSSPQVMQAVISNLHVLEINQTVLKLFEVQDSAHLLEHLDKVITPAAHTIHVEAVMAWLEGAAYYRAETCYQTLQGEPRYVWLEVQYPGDNTQAHQLTLCLQDITARKQAEQLLRASEHRLQQFASQVTDLIWHVDQALNFTFVNPAVEDVLGYPVEAMLARPFQEWVPVHYAQMLTRMFRIAVKNINRGRQAGNLVQTIELAMRTKQGGQVWLEMKCSLLLDEQRQPIGALGIARDVTERRLAEQEMRLAAAVFEDSLEGILIMDTQRKILRVNKAFTLVTGYEAEEVIGQPISMFNTQREHDGQRYQEICDALGQGDYWRGEVWQQRKNGEIYPQWQSISAVKDPNGRVINYTCIFTDVTDKKRSEQRIHRLAYYDPLTQLPNRSLFQDRLQQAVSAAKADDTWVALLFIDLDRFKAVNDSLGHPAGDTLLNQAAQRLQQTLRQDTVLARMGGDEFTIILSSLSSKERAISDASLVAERILESMDQPFILSGREAFISASIGIALSPQDGDEITTLLQNADLALYHAKSQGRDNYQFFAEELNYAAMTHLEMEAALRGALQGEQFQLHYQPQVCARTHTLKGVEALVRWQHPVQGMVSPVKFIPVAEETGLIITLGAWVLRRACLDAMQWRRQGINIERVSVNLSGRQFSDGGLINLVHSVLHESGLNPRCLTLELTESALIQDVEKAVMTLKQLKELGVHIAVDDFGTGYSSLNYLKRFPIDVLKIDRSFVKDIGLNREDTAVTSAVIALAHSLDLSVVAEGVETQAQIEFLQRKGCDVLQGFYYSPPLEESELLSWQQRWHVPMYTPPLEASARH